MTQNEALIPTPPPGLNLRLRPEQAADEAFLRQLYRRSRDHEMTRAGLDPELMRDFLDSQFLLQRRHYRTHYSTGGAFLLILRQDQPIGRLYTHWHDGEMRVVDITLLPDWRGQGIGTALLNAVKDLARARGGRVSLHVDPVNPAIALYQRLDFIAVDTSGASWRLEWRPAPL